MCRFCGLTAALVLLLGLSTTTQGTGRLLLEASNTACGQNGWLVGCSNISSATPAEVDLSTVASPSPAPLSPPSPSPEPPSPLPQPPEPSPSPLPLALGVHSRCPLGCSETGCVASTSGGYQCELCLSDLLVNSTDGTCMCPPGRWASGELDCSDCPKGSWCLGGTYAGPGSPGSTPCGELLTTTGLRSTSISLCVNVPGTFYSADANGDNPVATLCPSKLAAATDAQCLGVPEGYFIVSAGVVAPCPMGEYKMGVGSVSSCDKCPAGTTTAAPASPSPDSCNVLLPGYSPLSITEEGGIAETQVCPQRFYCPGGQPTAMFDAEWGAAETEGTTVVRCPNGTWTQSIGATDVGQCTTPPGFETVDGATTECSDTGYRAEWVPVGAGARCELCGNGISASATDFVTVYAPTPDANTTQLPVKTSGAACYIRAGQGVYYSASTNTYTAVDCGPGQFGLPNMTYGLVAWPCRSCSDGLTTSRDIPESAQYYVDYCNGRGGFTSEKACVTLAGYGYDGRRSTRCPVGSYNPPGSLSSCTRCPYGLSTADNPLLQVSVNNCTLAPGYGFHDGAIVPCPIGTFNDELRSNTTAACSSCPQGQSTSTPGASSLAHCDVCATGYGEADCATQCGGASGANFGVAGRELGASCDTCPVMSTGFSFDYLAVNQPFIPSVVARTGADSSADCLAEFAQIADSAWFMGGSATLDPVSGVSTFDGCVAACKSEDTCQYITFNYDDSTCSMMTSDQSATPGTMLAFKAVVAGDITAASINKGKGLASGSYTFWKSAATGIGASSSAGPTDNYQACLSACDADGQCAAVAMTGVTSDATATISGCSLIRGNSSIATFKRSVTRAVADRLTVAAAL